MFKRTITIHLHDTDATGVLYFPQQFNFAIITLEECLAAKGAPLPKLLESCGCLLPIVRAEANYTCPLRLGDPIEISLSVAKIGTSSFTLHYHLLHLQKGVDAGEVLLVHVAVDKCTKNSMPIPPSLRELLVSI